MFSSDLQYGPLLTAIYIYFNIDSFFVNPTEQEDPPKKITRHFFTPRDDIKLSLSDSLSYFSTLWLFLLLTILHTFTLISSI